MYLSMALADREAILHIYNVVDRATRGGRDASFRRGGFNYALPQTLSDGTVADY